MTYRWQVQRPNRLLLPHPVLITLTHTLDGRTRVFSIERLKTNIHFLTRAIRYKTKLEAPTQVFDTLSRYRRASYRQEPTMHELFS